MLYKQNDTIGSYTVIFPIKKGDYAETYRVKDISGQTRFMKLISNAKLKRHQINDDGQVLEAKVCSGLTHNNLCHLLDTGVVIARGGQHTYMVSEFISGETLAQRVIRESNIGVYEIKTIAKAVLSALHYLHTLPNPIIHGEVTIQNVLLDLAKGLQDSKLIDFGNSRFLSQPPVKPDLSSANVFYMAPERFSGVSQVQSDLYSVGAMMYYLLCGELPWFIDVSKVSGDKVDAILSTREKGLKFPTKEIFELDEQLINCISKALAYDVEDRFQTADEFIRALNGEIKLDSQETSKKRNSTGTGSQTAASKEKTDSRPKGPGFSAIAGMDDLKLQMKEEVIDPLHNPEEYQRYGITIPNGMLLYGPPGCGKTFFAKHFAEEVGFNFMCLSSSSLKSRYVNATQENIAKMFKDAEENAPTIIFIDEINELVPSRESDIHEMSRSAVNEMLAQMDRTGEKGIFVIGATNYPHLIDQAILRAGRLEYKFYVGVPDKTAREALFKMYLEKRPYDFGLDYSCLADLTENYVSADIELIVRKASQAARKAHSNITMDILREAISQCRPSLTAEELMKYEDIRKKMTGEKPITPQRKKIGFK